jgi:hypothetical protein
VNEYTKLGSLPAFEKVSNELPAWQGVTAKEQANSLKTAYVPHEESDKRRNKKKLPTCNCTNGKEGKS